MGLNIYGIGNSTIADYLAQGLEQGGSTQPAEVYHNGRTFEPWLQNMIRSNPSVAAKVSGSYVPLQGKSNGTMGHSSRSAAPSAGATPNPPQFLNPSEFDLSSPEGRNKIAGSLFGSLMNEEPFDVRLSRLYDTMSSKLPTAPDMGDVFDNAIANYVPHPSQYAGQMAQATGMGAGANAERDFYNANAVPQLKPEMITPQSAPQIAFPNLPVHEAPHSNVVTSALSALLAGVAPQFAGQFLAAPYAGAQTAADMNNAANLQQYHLGSQQALAQNQNNLAGYEAANRAAALNQGAANEGQRFDIGNKIARQNVMAPIMGQSSQAQAIAGALHPLDVQAENAATTDNMAKMEMARKQMALDTFFKTLQAQSSMFGHGVSALGSNDAKKTSGIYGLLNHLGQLDSRDNATDARRQNYEWEHQDRMSGQKVRQALGDARNLTTQNQQALYRQHLAQMGDKNRQSLIENDPMLMAAQRDLQSLNANLNRLRTTPLDGLKGEKQQARDAMIKNAENQLIEANLRLHSAISDADMKYPQPAAPPPAAAPAPQGGSTKGRTRSGSPYTIEP